MVISADNCTSDLSCLKASPTKDGKSKPLDDGVRFSNHKRKKNQGR